MVLLLNAQASIAEESDKMKPFPTTNSEAKVNILLIVHLQELELKPLLKHLNYVFLGETNILLVIISITLTSLQENKLLRILRNHKLSIRWTIADIRGINPATCMHKIFFKEGHKPSVEPQRHLNPIMGEIVKKEILK